MTHNSGSDILLSGMQLKPNIIIALSRKAVCITFILLISVNFSLGSALSDDCKGGPDCANCVAWEHSYMPGDVAEMENTSCRHGDKNTDCGLETGRIPDDANRIALTDRSDSHAYSGIFRAESDVSTRPNLSERSPSQFDSPEIDGVIPLYLLNDSLLC